MLSDASKDLEALLIEAGKTHHQAFIAVNGEDAEWPRWYANFMLERLNSLLATRLTCNELAGLLIQFEDERKASGANSWPKFYAERFVRLPSFAV